MYRPIPDKLRRMSIRREERALGLGKSHIFAVCQKS